MTQFNPRLPFYHLWHKLLVGFVFLFLINHVQAQEELIVVEPSAAEIQEFTVKSMNNFVRGKESEMDSLLDCSILEGIDSTKLSQYERVSVEEMLIELCTDDVNLVIISEHHFQPRSRALLMENLTTLRNLGYENLFLEALSYEDLELKERGFPLMSSARYLQDPIHGELIRYALELGFKLYPYEQKPEQREFGNKKIIEFLNQERAYFAAENIPYDKKRDAYESNRVFRDMSARDYVQYRNIVNFIGREDTTRSVVICGHGHGLKYRYGGWLTMGWWFDESPSFNVVSIDCSDGFDVALTSSEHDSLTCLFDHSEPYTLRTKAGQYRDQKAFQPYAEEYVSGRFDATVIYPTAQQTGEWHTLNGRREKLIFTPDEQTPNPPFTVGVFYRSEIELHEGAVPIDVFYVDDMTKEYYYYGYGDEIFRYKPDIE